jgi:hypothetical protein
VENDVKQAKALGLNRWPSRHWAINVAWPQVVVVAARQPAPSARGVQARGVQARGVQARAQAIRHTECRRPTVGMRLAYLADELRIRLK